MEVQPDVPGFLNGLDFDKFKPMWGTMSKGFSLPQYTLRYKDVPFAPLDGIHAITGQSGHGKTMTFSIVMAAILNGDYMGLQWNLPAIEPKVLYIDTEMEERNTMMVIARVHTMTGFSINEDRDDFRWMNLREVEKAEDRWSYVKSAIEEYRPTVVFLDGNLDLINDFNDNQQCQEHIRQCMSIASYYGISVWCLVHENPGSTKMVGHLGSMLERKVTDIFEAKKVKNKGETVPVFEIEAKKTRGRDVPTLKFVVEQDKSSLGIPSILDDYDKADNQEKEDGLKASPAELFPMVMQPGIKYSQNELINLIRPKLKTSTMGLRAFIGAGVDQGILEYSSYEQGKKTFHQYKLANDDEKIFTSGESGEPQDLPF